MLKTIKSIPLSIPLQEIEIREKLLSKSEFKKINEERLINVVSNYH